MVGKWKDCFIANREGGPIVEKNWRATAMRSRCSYGDEKEVALSFDNHAKQHCHNVYLSFYVA